jgi:CDP-diacylglycerol--glycerol-3-phosphate 3-phosphatidyltransferase/cardiolipin synthase
LIPNLISLSRLPLAAAFVHYADHAAIAVAILCLGGISDWLDGWAAKKLSQQSRFGALLDPVCDRIFIVTVLVTLWLVHDIPYWQLLVLLARDVANSLGAGVLWALRPDDVWSLRARTSGKVVTSLQTWSVVHIVLGLPFLEISIAVVALATLWALVDYYRFLRERLGASKSVSTP